MSSTLPIGDFSRATHLSVKMLRHYHEIGLLEPADVEVGSGYRRYAAEQIVTAQIIRRKMRGQPWNGCLTVVAISAARAALPAATPANHAATFPPQSTISLGYRRACASGQAPNVPSLDRDSNGPMS